ncbi:hypothetical protein DERP_000005 [Dermatophagoides pteronyssinus]|uniref:Uncharacterized protein n=1 Tax=Dermatophagoides pteronyssinus TaxID=6956 RepID=A0ABQ8IYY3_DERPT|nr:hypothetical protein DERP_000005 [Dermatophagoides pteronyssinus]
MGSLNDPIGSRSSTSSHSPSSSASSSSSLSLSPLSSTSLLCRLIPSSSNTHYNSMGHNVVGMNGGDNESIQVVFSAQSRDAIIYVTVVLVIYIIIFVVLVVTSYRKSSALRETLNRHLRSQYATGPFGTPTILETDSNGDQVHCDTVDELHEGSIQL